MLAVLTLTRCRELRSILPLARRLSRSHRTEGFHLARFFSDDCTDRFQHVREATPQENLSCVENFPAYLTTTVPTKGDIDSSDDGGTAESVLQDVPLETIEDAILQFVPENVNTDSVDTGCLNPGKVFYLENKDKLFENIRKRYQEVTKGADGTPLTDNEIESLLPLLMEEEQFGSYDPNPVIPPTKHHLWDYSTNEIYVPRKTIHLHKGKMPTLQEITDILEQERMANIAVVDMDNCNRRDQSMYCIVATGTTRSHCRRVGRMLYRVIVDLEIPYVSATSYCCNSRSDEWIVARLGPLCVHLMVQTVRDTHSIEELWAESRATEDQKDNARIEEE